MATFNQTPKQQARDNIDRQLVQTGWLVQSNVIFFDHKPVRKDPRTKEVRISDFHTHIHFTLKKTPLKYADRQVSFKIKTALNLRLRPYG